MDTIRDKPTGSPRLMWLMVIALTGVMFLVTGSPVAGAITPVLASLRRPFQSAVWIRLNDPFVGRGKACFWYLLATGCWNALVSGLIALFLLFVLANTLNEVPDIEQGGPVLIVVAVSTVGTSLIGLIALRTARKHGVRVWVHPSLRDLAQGDFPQLYGLLIPPVMCNHAIYVTAISMAFPGMAVATGWLMWIADAAPPNARASIATAIGLFLLLAWPILSIVLLVRISPKVFADDPLDCWLQDASETQHSE